MARKRKRTRRAPRIHPRGPIDIRRDGYGFVLTAEGEFFIPASKINGAFPDDIVEIAPIHSHRRGGIEGRSDRKRTARVVSVVERATDELIGYFHREDPFGVVEPLDGRIPHDVFIKLEDAKDVPDGAVVRVGMTSFPDRKSAATGVVLEVLGDGDDESIPMDMIIARHKLETTFSEPSLVQAREARAQTEEALSRGYRDLRDRITFTVDPTDAKDFDDALSLEPATLPDGKEGWRLGVHIADVSSYVPFDSSIDLDARRRATSVYLADRVIPMLPEELSNDICSLRPGEDRRSMTVDLLVSKDGRVLSADIYPAVIRSDARLTYDQALAVIEGDEGALAGVEVDGLEERIRNLAALTQLLMDRRKAAGGLDFETVEAKVRLDDGGVPIGIDIRERTAATEMVEASMIAANEAVAEFLRDKGFPGIYRVHEQPSHDSLEALIPVLSEYPWFARIDERAFCAGDPKAIQQVLTSSADRPEAMLVSTLVLRAMKRAVYSEHLQDHFGLASRAYAHFTSPIRRYPDLVVHRMLKAALFGRPERFDREVSNLGWMAEHSSEMERIAEQAERDSQELKIVEYMEGFLGQTFPATISGVGTVGLFVRLENTAEGIVPMADLGREYFVLDPIRHTLTGSDSGKRFGLGQRVAVQLVEADRRTGRLRFRLA